MVGFCSTNVTINGSLLHHNTAVSNTTGAGGVLVALQQCTIILNHCEVWNNTAMYGTVLNMGIQTTATFFNSTVWNNLGNHGGVISMVDANITIDRSRFYHNTATMMDY